jgi:repressor LexA
MLSSLFAARSMARNMEPMSLGQRFRRVRRRLGENQTLFARRFGVDQTTVSKWEKDRQIPEGHNLDILAGLEETDLPPNEEIVPNRTNSLFTLVPVVGDIGAGAAVYPAQDDNNHPMGYIRAARGFGAVEALRVRGDSMWPAYRDGDMIYIEARAADFPLERNREYILQLADGRRILKMVEPARLNGRYNLISYNAPPESDIEITGAQRVRYVRKA